MATLTGTGIWAHGLRYGDPGAAAEAAAELEGLGYSALWIPDVGGDVFGAVDNLLAATRSATVATGILNLWMHTPGESAAAWSDLTSRHGDRFLMGIGVSHAMLIDADEPGRWRRPLSAMAEFLDGLDASDRPVPPGRRVLAALGPRMLELAGRRTAGTHSYNVTPEHTAEARKLLGPSAAILPEMAVVLSRDAAEARRLARQHLHFYFQLPNYTNNLRRFGFGDDDFASDGSDRLIDALVAWGDEATIAARLGEHRAAGADHICIQVLSGDGQFPVTVWRALAPALV